MPSNFGIELRSLTHGCCERTNICRRWDARPIRAETRAKLVASIARGRRWLDEMVTGAVTSIEQIAARDKCSVRQVNMTIGSQTVMSEAPMPDDQDKSWALA